MSGGIDPDQDAGFRQRMENGDILFGEGTTIFVEPEELLLRRREVAALERIADAMTQRNEILRRHFQAQDRK